MHRQQLRRFRYVLGRIGAARGVALHQRPLCRPIGGTVESNWRLGCATGAGCDGAGRPIGLFLEPGHAACARLRVRAVKS